MFNRLSHERLIDRITRYGWHAITTFNFQRAEHALGPGRRIYSSAWSRKHVQASIPAGAANAECNALPARPCAAHLPPSTNHLSPFFPTPLAPNPRLLPCPGLPRAVGESFCKQKANPSANALLSCTVK